MPEIMKVDVREEHSSQDERDFDVLPDLIYNQIRTIIYET
jgi:hypothetical protein